MSRVHRDILSGPPRGRSASPPSITMTRCLYSAMAMMLIGLRHLMDKTTAYPASDRDTMRWVISSRTVDIFSEEAKPLK